jgi:DNA-binding transcriptional LysR family regulator
MNKLDYLVLLERMMDLADLRIFRSVVEEGGITRAATKLNRVQSNVTTRVRQLEQDLGVDLFIREGKRLHLSPTGKLLLDYADRLLDLAQEARDAVHDGTPRGPFRLGAMESTAAIRLPDPLSTFHRRYPDVQLDLHTDTIARLSETVLTGELDAALVAEPINDPALDKTMVYDEELVLVADAAHGPIRSPRDVVSQTVLAFEHGCAYRLRMQQWFARAGVLPERIVEISSWHALVGCVAARMGIAVVPRMVLTTFPQSKFLSIHPLPAEVRHAPTMLIWRKGGRSPKIAALLEVLTESAGSKSMKRKAKKS